MKDFKVKLKMIEDIKNKSMEGCTNMKIYKVTLMLNYNHIFLEVIISRNNIITTRKLAEKVGNSGEIFLTNNKLNLVNDDMNHCFDITDIERDLYQFQICKKEMKPIDTSKLSAKEILDLMYNEDYMTDENDYVNVDWSISEVYKRLKDKYLEKDVFKFDSLAYGIEEVGK